MRTHLTKVSLALLAAAFVLGCQEQGSGPAEPDVLVLPFEPQFDKKGPPGKCPGAGDEGPFRDEKGHCHGDGDGVGNDKETKVALDDPLSANPQAATFTSNPNLIQGGAPNDCGTFGCFSNVLDLLPLTGPPLSGNPKVLSETCTTDPADLLDTDPEVLARLIDRLDDDAQLRKFYTRIDLKSVRVETASKVHRIRQDWIDNTDALFYTTSLGTHGLRPDEIVTVSETGENTNVFVFSGGSWKSWERDTPLPGAVHGAMLVCKNMLTVTMTITDL